MIFLVTVKFQSKRFFMIKILSKVVLTQSIFSNKGRYQKFIEWPLPTKNFRLNVFKNISMVNGKLARKGVIQKFVKKS